MTCLASPPPDRLAPEIDALALKAFDALDTLAPDHPRLGVAVSGGSDSTALLLLAADWARARGVQLFAATVDHGLRPEAAAEARSVGDVCARLGVNHATLVWRPPAGVRIAQADARLARHRLLAQWAADNALPAIAIGHTRDDRIETFLIRARAGSGWWGLSGPAPRSASPYPQAGDMMLVRPLLGMARADLRGWLMRRGETWSEDPSNTAIRFERVRMRALAARLGEAHQAKVIAVMDRLAGLRAAAMAAARDHLLTAEATPDGAGITVPGLGPLGVEARLRLAEALVLAFGRRPAPPAGDRLARLAAALAHSEFPAITLGGVWFTARNGSVLVRQAPPRRGAAPAATGNGSQAIAGLLRARALLVEPGLSILAG